MKNLNPLYEGERASKVLDFIKNAPTKASETILSGIKKGLDLSNETGLTRASGRAYSKLAHKGKELGRKLGGRWARFSQDHIRKPTSERIKKIASKI